MGMCEKARGCDWDEGCGGTSGGGEVRKLLILDHLEVVVNI